MPDLHGRDGALLLAGLLSLWACGGSGEADGGREAGAPAALPGSPGAGSGTRGTLTATVDGQERTWYVVSGSIGGEPHATGGWIETSSGKRGIAVVGFDREQVPLESFEWNSDGMLAGYGNYTGSLLSLMLFVEGDPSSLRVRFPPEPGQTHAVVYMPRATATDLSHMYLLAEGSLDVSAMDFDGGQLRIEGTFSGTFRTMDERSTVRISNGRFRAAGLGRLRPVKGGGR